MAMGLNYGMENSANALLQVRVLAPQTARGPKLAWDHIVDYLIMDMQPSLRG